MHKTCTKGLPSQKETKHHGRLYAPWSNYFDICWSIKDAMNAHCEHWFGKIHVICEEVWLNLFKCIWESGQTVFLQQIKRGLRLYPCQYLAWFEGTHLQNIPLLIDVDWCALHWGVLSSTHSVCWHVLRSSKGLMYKYVQLARCPNSTTFMATIVVLSTNRIFIPPEIIKWSCSTTVDPRTLQWLRRSGWLDLWKPPSGWLARLRLKWPLLQRGMFLSPCSMLENRATTPVCLVEHHGMNWIDLHSKAIHSSLRIQVPSEKMFGVALEGPSTFWILLRRYDWIPRGCHNRSNGGARHQGWASPSRLVHSSGHPRQLEIPKFGWGASFSLPAELELQLSSFGIIFRASHAGAKKS